MEQFCTLEKCKIDFGKAFDADCHNGFFNKNV
jgi:hypothetical protein